MDRQPVANRFKDKAAIVTGAASGIGRAVAQELCREGAAVLVLDMSPSGQTVVDELVAAGCEARFFYHADVADGAACRQAAAAALEKWGRLDYLVNNAFSFLAKGLDATPEDWDRSLHVGPVGYAMVQAVVPAMQQAGGGAIVNLSSISAFIAQPNRWTYNAAKGAV